MKYSEAEKEWYDSQGLWDHFLGRPCHGAEDLVHEVRAHDLTDKFADIADSVNSDLEDTGRALTDEELRTLWRISHEDYLVYGRAIELAHGISRT